MQIIIIIIRNMQEAQRQLRNKIKSAFGTNDETKIKSIKNLIKSAPTEECLLKCLTIFGLDPSDKDHRRFVNSLYKNHGVTNVVSQRQETKLRRTETEYHETQEASNNQDESHSEEQQEQKQAKIQQYEQRIIPRATAQSNHGLMSQPKGILSTKNVNKGKKSKRQMLQLKKVRKQRANTKRNEFKQEGFLTQDYKSHIELAIKEKQIVVVYGDSSNMTRQLPIFLLEKYSNIVCTHPSKFIAIDNAWRTGHQLNFGEGFVGYLTEQNKYMQETTKIIYATEGIIINQLMINGLLKSDSVLILAGAHHRTKSFDIIMAILKKRIKNQQRQTPKIIITSSNQQQAKIISRYLSLAFQDIIAAPTKYHPVAITYSKMAKRAKDENEYLKSCVDQIVKVHKRSQEGNIVCFVSNQENLQRATSLLQEQLDKLDQNHTKLLISTPSEQSQWRPKQESTEKSRKCIIATQTAEISFTKSPKYIIDCGIVKKKAEESFSKRKEPNIWISKSQANERAYLAAAVPGGQCFRLYTNWRFSQMTEQIIPELLRVSTSTISLMKRQYEIEDIDLICSPSSNTISKTLNQLCQIGPFRRQNVGQILTDLSIDPKIATVMAYSAFYNCVDETAIICSMITVKDAVFDSSFLTEEIEAARQRFFQPKGDFFVLLRVYQDWKKSGYNAQWCKPYSIRIKALLYAREVKERLINILRKANMIEGEVQESIDEMINEAHVRKCLLHGFSANLAQLHKKNSYRTKQGKKLILHQSSPLFKSKPKCIIFDEVIEKNLMSLVCEMEPEWICDFEPSPKSYEY